MRAQLRRVLDRGIRWSPAQTWFRHRRQSHLLVLAYHSVPEPAAFKAQLEQIRAWRLPVSLNEILDAQGDSGRVPEGATLVTFDDGDRSVFEVAAPILVELRVPGVVFVVTAVVDSERPLWWDEAGALTASGARSQRLPIDDGEKIVRALKRMPDDERLAILEELRQQAMAPRLPRSQLTSEELVQLEGSGIEIGNHSHSHPCLSRCSTQKVESEIRTAHEMLTSALGHSPRAFAYPDGDWDARADSVLRALGYEAAFLFDHRLRSIDHLDPMLISRVRVDATASPDRFAILASGLHPALHHGLGRR